MNNTDLITQECKKFETIKKVREDGSVYWSARELSILLDYSQWRSFENVIRKAMIAFDTSGYNSIHEFVDISSQNTFVDYELSRFACYLTIQNADPRKEIVAHYKTYFAMQTFRQESPTRFDYLKKDPLTTHHLGEKEKCSKTKDVISENLSEPEKSSEELFKERYPRLKELAKQGKLMLDE